MDSYSGTSPPLTPEASTLEYIRGFETETCLDDTESFLDQYSLGHTNAKVTVLTARRHPPEESELDGSYTEFEETQWTKGSGSDGEGLSSSSHSSIKDVSQEGGSDTESVVVSAPLHGPSMVRCVCVCNKKGCEYVNKPHDLHSMRESPAGRMSLRYRMITWLRSFWPPAAHTPTTDAGDVGSRVYPERKFKIVQLFRRRRARRSSVQGPDGEVAPNTVEGLGRSFDTVDGAKRPSVFPSQIRRRLKACEISVPRTIGVMIGVTLIMLGVTYDHGVKHGVDNLLQECWSWLRTSYMNFGDEFVSYNSLFFRITNTEVLGEPYPRYGLNSTKKESNVTRFQEAISKVDPRFLFVLEGLKLSVQLHFFSIDEKADSTPQKVLVHDKGPLFLRISFKRTSGLHVDYIPERSTMTLSTSFQVYDLMKMIILSNELPYFGMHMHDYHKTDPSALLNMIINNLKTFNVDTTFLSSIQQQIQKGRIKRDISDPPSATTATPLSITNNVGASQGTHEYTTNTSSLVATPHHTGNNTPTTQYHTMSGYHNTLGHATKGPIIGGGLSTIGHHATSRHKTAVTTGLPEGPIIASTWAPVTRAIRARRSTEEPDRSKTAWRSIAEISKKIFLPLPLDTKKTVLLPVPFIEKNLTLRFRHNVDFLGLPGYQFVLGNSIGGRGDFGTRSELYPSLSYSRVKDGERPETSPNGHTPRHRLNERRKHNHRHSKHQTLPDGDVFRSTFSEVLGVVDMEPLLLDTIGRLLLMGRYIEHYPFWLSPPHFLSLTDHVGNGSRAAKGGKVAVLQGTSPQLSPGNSNLILGVEGIAANESLHGSFIYYHPILGVPINASLAVQVGIRPPEGMLHAHKLVPIMWARIQVEEIPVTLWYILWAACHLRETIMSCFIITGLLIITCSLTCNRRRAGAQDSPNSA